MVGEFLYPLPPFGLVLPYFRPDFTDGLFSNRPQHLSIRSNDRTRL